MTFTFKLSMRLALMRAVLLPAAAATFVACELPGRRPTDPGSPNNVVVQVFTSPDSITLDPDETRQFLAFGRTQSGDSVPVAVRWSASGGTITTDGLYTAGPSFGTYQITATATTSSVQSSSTVKNRGALTEVFVTPATVSVSAGGTRQFFAYGRKRNGDSVSVNVSYTATGGGISAAGLYSAGQNAGSYRVIAVNGPTALADTAAVAISILPVASVTVAPATASVAVGQVAGLVATLRDANGNALSGRVVTWASSAAAVATVDSSGVVTGVAVGGAMVSATSEGQSGAALVSVAAAPAPVASVAVSPATASVVAGQAVQLAATPKDASGNALSGRVVTWASSAPAVAAVNGSGLVTGGAAGAATITATSEGQSGGAAVTITAAVTSPALVSDLAVSSVTANGLTLAFTEVNDGTGQPAKYDVRYAAGTIAFGAATGVTQGTCVRPVLGSAIGARRTCTILGLSSGTSYQVQLVSYRGVLDSNAVFGPLSNVASGTTAASTAPVATVTLTPASASVAIGAVQQFAAVLKDASGTVLTGRAVSWSSSSLTIAGVSGTGLVTGLVAGPATITASSEGQSGSAAVTVTALPTGGVVLLQESFDNVSLNTRGWYDGGAATISTTEYHAGGGSIEARFLAGAVASSWSTKRQLFTPTPTVYVSFW